MICKWCQDSMPHDCQNDHVFQKYEEDSYYIDYELSVHRNTSDAGVFCCLDCIIAYLKSKVVK